MDTPVWAIVELMGHGLTAGKLHLSDFGGLLRVEVPTEETFRTEFYGASAIYSIKIVSEEIARAYARPREAVIAYDEPIVTREQYEKALQLANAQIRQLEYNLEVITRRLTVVSALPSPETDTT